MSDFGVPGGEAGRDLYGLDPDQFTAARNALAKQLKASGDKDGAALVAKLRRPSTTAWALNRLARDQPGVLDAVLDAGAGLRTATEAALEGDASSLRTAQAWERRSVDAATSAGASVLSAAGLGAGDAARQRMAGTLRAAMVDGDVAAAVRAGVLDDDRDAPGFGLDAFSAAAAGSATRRRTPTHTRSTATEAETDDQRAADEVAEEAVADPGAAEAAGGDAAAEAEAAAARSAAVAQAKADADRAAERAADLARTADASEQATAAARDAAATARAEADRAMATAAELETAADAAAADATTARAVADEAATQAADAKHAADSLTTAEPPAEPPAEPRPSHG